MTFPLQARADGHDYFSRAAFMFVGLGVMFYKFWLVASVLPLAGCVTDTKRDSVVLSMPAVNQAADAPTDGDDPLGLQAAIALVRQQPWCVRSARTR